MAEVQMVPGKGYVVTATDGEAKQIPGMVYFVEAAAAVSAVKGTIFGSVIFKGGLIRSA